MAQKKSSERLVRDINETPADVYFGRNKKILKNRDLLKQKTMRERRKLHLLNSSNV